MRRRRFIVSLISSGLDRVEGVQTAAEKGQMSKTYARVLWDRVRNEWRKSGEETEGTARVEAIHRIRRDLAELRNPKQLRNANGYPVFENVLDAAGRPIKDNGRNRKRPVQASVDWARVIAHERFLADLEGTMAPIEVKVDVDMRVQKSITAVIANLDSAQMDELVAQDRERERLALIAKRAGLDPMDTRVSITPPHGMNGARHHASDGTPEPDEEIEHGRRRRKRDGGGDG